MIATLLGPGLLPGGIDAPIVLGRLREPGRSIFDIESINETFDNRLAGNPAARALLGGC